MNEPRSTLGLLPAIAGRYSPRAYSDRPVTDEELTLVLEAARWAPSSMNEQPWRFLVTRRDGEGHAALLDGLDHSNRIWAEKAPVLMLALVHRILHRLNAENHHARHDLGLAVGQLGVQATSMGMGMHQLGGFSPAKVRAAFAIPEVYDLVTVIVLGWPGDAAGLPQHLQERERTRSARKPLAELVHYGRFKP
ncbi:MAG: nitroreductase family protein [Flavobacteriales bacterium]|nr:nitroreductase family protein [Flavobacteriales bacterium]NUQ16469.1 nitroreductase family protein [Flavobacteriales bacterium]